MRFSQVIGQAKIKKSLLHSFAEGRVSHAQLFLGQEGTGALALALACATYVNCLNPTETDSCGTCASCRKADKFIHPDIHFSFPTIGSKAVSDQFLPQWREAMKDNPYLNAYQWLGLLQAENKQGNITAQECEHIMRKLSFKAFEGKYKVLILWMPEYLGKEGNRLLKLIEEPAPNTLFLLVAERSELILNTILSRCQLLHIPRLDEDSLTAHLQKLYQIPDTLARRAAVLAEGNLNAAKSIMEKGDADARKLLLLWWEATLAKDAAAQVELSDQIAKVGRESQKHLLRNALHFLRQCLMLKSLPKAQQNTILNSEELDMAEKLMHRIATIDQMMYLMRLFSDAVLHIERNANPRILFLSLSLRVGALY